MGSVRHDPANAEGENAENGSLSAVPAGEHSRYPSPEFGLATLEKSTMAMKTNVKKAKKKNAMKSKPVPKHYIFAMKFAKVYPLYVQKAEAKNRTKEEVDQIICWLTGYTQAGLQKQLEREC